MPCSCDVARLRWPLVHRRKTAANRRASRQRRTYITALKRSFASVSDVTFTIDSVYGNENASHRLNQIFCETIESDAECLARAHAVPLRRGEIVVGSDAGKIGNRRAAFTVRRARYIGKRWGEFRWMRDGLERPGERQTAKRIAEESGMNLEIMGITHGLRLRATCSAKWW